MKLTDESSSGIFMMVSEFLQRSTERLHLDSGGSFPIFSWMKWHHTGFYSFQPLLSVFGCRELRGDVFCTFFVLFFAFWELSVIFIVTILDIAHFEFFIKMSSVAGRCNCSIEKCSGHDLPPEDH